MKRRAISQRSQRRKGIDLSDIPEVSPEQFARAIVRRGLKPVRHKAQVTLRIDSEVIDWFGPKAGDIKLASTRSSRHTEMPTARACDNG